MRPRVSMDDKACCDVYRRGVDVRLRKLTGLPVRLNPGVTRRIAWMGGADRRIDVEKFRCSLETYLESV